jgi:DNA-binding GntR family transcriptional regulator
MNGIFQKEDRSTLVVKVANQIREAIKSGKLKPGEHIIEGDLAMDMGISRFPIREAIRYLEKEGLVTTTPYKGAHVTELTEKDLEEIYSLRTVIEELAIRTLIKHLDSEKVKKLESVVTAMKQVAKNCRTIEEIIDVDLSFHRTICELAENRRLLELWLNLSHQLRAFIVLDDHLYGDDTPEKTLETHYPVFEAIKKEDSDLAVNQMKKVMTRGYKNALKYYRRKNDNP